MACLVQSFPHGQSSSFTREWDLKEVKTGSVAERKAYYDSFKKRNAVDDEKKSKISSFSTLSTKSGIYKCAPQTQNGVKNSEAKTPLKATFEANENDNPNIQGYSSQLQLPLESSLWRRHLVQWSAFTRDRQMEEVKRYCKPGSVAEIKSYFEAQFKKLRAAALLEQQNVVAKEGDSYINDREFEEVSESLISLEKTRIELNKITKNDEGSGDDIVSKKEDKTFNEGNSSLPHWTSTLSFGRWNCVIWSAFTRDRNMEEVKRYCKLGSVDEKKVYFEAQFKKWRAAALHEQQNVVAKDREFEEVSNPLISVQKTQVELTKITENDKGSGDDIVSKKEDMAFNKGDFDKRKLASLNEKKSKISSSSTLSTSNGILKCAPSVRQIMPCQVKNSVKNSEAKSQLKARTLTLENLKSMRVLKLHSWEPMFMEKLLRLRETENGWLNKCLYTSSGTTFYFWASPTLVLVITFGKEMDRALYENVVGQCALNQDIEMWTVGDLCVVKKRGLKLSRGQKQSIEMARALYSNTDIYLLDDPFSDVDAHMFQKYLMQLLHEKTVFHVTRQLEFLDASDLVLVVKGRKLFEVENYRDLILVNQVDTQKCVGLPKVYHQAAAANQIEVTEINSADLSRSNKAPEQSPFEVMETGRVKWHVYATATYRRALVSIIMLFITMSTSFFRASLSFFDSTPSSRILNWSSTGQSIVDTDIPCRLGGLSFGLIKLLSIVVVMWQVPWQIFFLFLIVFAISDWYHEHYISTARELARMVLTQHAPILHQFSGASLIRSFCEEDGFSVNLVDDYPRVFNLVFFLLLIIILVSHPWLDIDPSLASWVIWNFCNVENKTIPCEAPLLIEDSRPHPELPLHGIVDIENDHVLQNDNEI